MRSISSIIEFIVSSPDIISGVRSLGSNETRMLIDKADAAYYRIGRTQSLISDEIYDAARNHLRTMCPDDPRLTRVGVQYDTSELRNKVTHTIPMGSLDNTDDGIAGYDKWYDWILTKLNVDETTIFASLKIDGGSVRARYVDGKLITVATRGNGTIGEDITANAINFQYLPLELPEPITCDVRGEAILYIDDFEALMVAEHQMPFDDIPKNLISNPRNVGNGVLGRDNGQDSDKIRMLAFNIITEGVEYDSELHKITHLRELGFNPVPNVICNNRTDLRNFYDTIADSRNGLPFEIDGVVVVVNDTKSQDLFVTDDINSKLRPKHSRAIKFPHRSSTSKLKAVDITVGHTGAIIPTGIFDEVRVGGVNVQHALLNNWDEIDRLGLAIGDEAEIILAGDIIPKVSRVVARGETRKEIIEPKECPSCGKPTTREIRGKAGALTYCTDPTNCPLALFAKISHWVGGSKTGVGILGVGDTILKALWDQGIIKDPSDLYLLTTNLLQDIELDGGVRVGTSRAQMIVDNIQEKKHLPIHTFLGSLGIELLGRRRVQMLQKAADGKLDTLDNWLDTDNLRKLRVEGLGEAIRSAIISGIEANRPLIQRFLDKGVVVGEEQAVVQPVSSDNLVFAGLNFCLTGTRECQDDIVRLGGTLKSGVSKGLHYLVQKDPLSTSNKTQKAEEYGVKIISIDKLKEMIAAAGPVDSSIPAVNKVSTARKSSKPKQPSLRDEEIDSLVDSVFE